MKLTVCTDTRLFSKQVETKFEMILEEYNTKKLTLIGMPLEKLPLDCDGLPLILRKIYDYIIDYGLYEECLFDEAYSNNGRQENIISAYELVSGSSQNCRTIVDVDAVDVATVLVMWLYYLPEPLVTPKQFSMICDLKDNKTYGEIVSSMNIVSRQTLQRVINIVDSYEKQHKSYKEKLGSLFTLLLTKHIDVASQNNSLQFMDNLKTVLMETEMENDEYIMFNDKSSVSRENINPDENIFNSNNLCNKKSLFRSWSDNELNLKADAAQVNPIMMEMGSSLKKSSSCNLVKFFSKEDDTYSKSCNTDLSLKKENLKSKSKDILSDVPFHDNLDCAVDEFKDTPQIDDMRTIERTMPTHFKSTVKRNKKKSVKSHVDKILISGFLSNEDSLLLQNTLELMKILSKIKSVQNQINIQRRNWEDGFGFENRNIDNNFPDLHFLKTRLEHLVNQKNNYLSKTGLSYGKSYNRTVLNLKNAQKEALKLHEDEKNNQKSQNDDNIDNLISDIYDIQIVLDYLENNCGGRELPWRSSKGCPGHRRKTKKQLNCVAIVSDLQTIGEHEVMETIMQPLFKQVENASYTSSL